MYMYTYMCLSSRAQPPARSQRSADDTARVRQYDVWSTAPASANRESMRSRSLVEPPCALACASLEKRSGDEVVARDAAPALNEHAEVPLALIGLGVPPPLGCCWW